jgi:hypothetical protein
LKCGYYSIPSQTLRKESGEWMEKPNAVRDALINSIGKEIKSKHFAYVAADTLLEDYPGLILQPKAQPTGGNPDWAKADRERFLHKLVAVKTECGNAVGNARRNRFDRGCKWLAMRIQKIISTAGEPVEGKDVNVIERAPEVPASLVKAPAPLSLEDAKFMVRAVGLEATKARLKAGEDFKPEPRNRCPRWACGKEAYWKGEALITCTDNECANFDREIYEAFEKARKEIKA